MVNDCGMRYEKCGQTEVRCGDAKRSSAPDRRAYLPRIVTVRGGVTRLLRRMSAIGPNHSSVLFIVNAQRLALSTIKSFNPDNAALSNPGLASSSATSPARAVTLSVISLTRRRMMGRPSPVSAANAAHPLSFISPSDARLPIFIANFGVSFGYAAVARRSNSGARRGPLSSYKIEKFLPCASALPTIKLKITASSSFNTSTAGRAATRRANAKQSLKVGPPSLAYLVSAGTPSAWQKSSW